MGQKALEERRRKACYHSFLALRLPPRSWLSHQRLRLFSWESVKTQKSQSSTAPTTFMGIYIILLINCYILLDYKLENYKWYWCLISRMCSMAWNRHRNVASSWTAVDEWDKPFVCCSRWWSLTWILVVDELDPCIIYISLHIYDFFFLSKVLCFIYIRLTFVKKLKGKGIWNPIQRSDVNPKSISLPKMLFSKQMYNDHRLLYMWRINHKFGRG